MDYQIYTISFSSFSWFYLTLISHLPLSFICSYLFYVFTYLFFLFITYLLKKLSIGVLILIISMIIIIWTSVYF